MMYQDSNVGPIRLVTATLDTIRTIQSGDSRWKPTACVACARLLARRVLGAARGPCRIRTRVSTPPRAFASESRTCECWVAQHPEGTEIQPAIPARRIDQSTESIRDRPSPPGRCYRGGRHDRRPEETSIDVSGCWSARASLEGGETDAVQADHSRSPTDGRCPMPSRSKDASRDRCRHGRRRHDRR